MRQEWNNFLTERHKGKRTLAITLSAKQKIGELWLDETLLKQNVEHFLNRLNRATFGKAHKRFGKKFHGFYAIEGGIHSKRLHVHLTLEIPEAEAKTSLRNRLRMNYFKLSYEIRKAWGETLFGYREIVVKDVYDLAGWVDYSTKKRTKSADFLSLIEPF
jgi:hypothetical protein